MIMHKGIMEVTWGKNPETLNSQQVRRIFGFGETVLDIIFKDGKPVTAKPGGSVLNAFISLGRLGWNPCFISEYGLDDVGNLTEQFLRQNGVRTDYVNRFRDGHSALAIAFLDEQNNATYSFYKDFPEKRLQELPDDIGREDIIMFGSIYASNVAVRSSVVRFLDMGKNAGGVILYDPNFRKAHLSELEVLKPMILENISYADIIRGSDEDFHLIFGITDPDEIPGQLDLGSKILFYTQGDGSVKVYHGNSSLDIPVKKINAVSTIGAGDNFNAGIIHYILSRNLEREQLSGLAQEELMEMGSMGIDFARDICLSYENYISEEFAKTKTV